MSLIELAPSLEMVSSQIFFVSSSLSCLGKKLDKISNSMHRIIDENSKQFLSVGIEPINCITLIGENGISLFWPLKNYSSLALKVRHNTNLGKIRKEVNDLIPILSITS